MVIAMVFKMSSYQHLFIYIEKKKNHILLQVLQNSIAKETKQ
jgi:hypothetical protein